MNLQMIVEAAGSPNGSYDDYRLLINELYQVFVDLSYQSAEVLDLDMLSIAYAEATKYAKYAQDVEQCVCFILGTYSKVEHFVAKESWPEDDDYMNMPELRMTTQEEIICEICGNLPLAINQPDSAIKDIILYLPFYNSDDPQDIVSMLHDKFLNPKVTEYAPKLSDCLASLTCRFRCPKCHGQAPTKVWLTDLPQYLLVKFQRPKTSVVKITFTESLDIGLYVHPEVVTIVASRYQMIGDVRYSKYRADNSCYVTNIKTESGGSDRWKVHDGFSTAGFVDGVIEVMISVRSL